jgi:fumarate reductase subunit D
VILAAAIAFPLWGGAHHVRHLAIDLGGIARDAWFGALCYALALAGSVLAVVAVARL